MTEIKAKEHVARKDVPKCRRCSRWEYDVGFLWLGWGWCDSWLRSTEAGDHCEHYSYRGRANYD